MLFTTLIASSFARSVPSVVRVEKRAFWGWLNTITNKVDESRIKEVGPDRAAAEWLLRCGASVKWVGYENKFSDYNSLPPGEFRSFLIEEIDGTESCIMSVGFPHLKGLKHLKKITLHRCNYLDDEALPYLELVNDSLRHLQVSSCGNLTESGILSLRKLTNLRELLLFDLPEIKDKDKCLELLKSSLKNCNVEFSYARPEEIKQS